MHDPMVVAFEIRRPWPQRSRLHDTKPGQRRWRIRLHHDCGPNCAEATDHVRPIFPWWKPSSYSCFWTLAGRGWYFPALLVVWHVEPDGRDSGEVCKHYRRERQADGRYKTTYLRGWRWHVHHWRIQIPALQALRRRLLTRCEWCGGRQSKGDPVNVSHSWGRSRGRWWQGERGLYHHDCSSVAAAHLACVCEEPICANTDATGRPYGTCARCSKQRTIGRTRRHLQRQRILAAVPPAPETKPPMSGSAPCTQPRRRPTVADETFDQWAIVEMLGHRRVAGRVREVQLAGAGFLRLDIPATDGHPEQTQYIAPGSVYALHPVSEDVARAVAARFRPEPVHRWELPRAPLPDDAVDDREIWMRTNG